MLRQHLFPGVAGSALLLFLLLAAAPRGASADIFDPVPPPDVPGHFALSALDGSMVTDESFPGKWLVIYFGYTNCGDACPTTLTTIGTALDGLGPLADRIQPLFITIDPARDKVGTMTRYLEAFDPRILGLRGTPEQIEAAIKQFHVHFERSRTENGGYELDHTGFLYVISPDRHMTKLVSLDVPGDKLTTELRKLAQ